MTTDPLTTMQQRVLAEIESHQVSMRPKFYFVLHTITLVILATIILLLSISFSTYILFSIRASHHTPLLFMGGRGLLLFFTFFPWGVLFFDMVCIVAFQHILQKFRLGYKNPLLYTLAIVLVCMLGLVFVIDHVRIEDQILRHGHQTNMPLLFGAYEGAHAPTNPDYGVCPCIVKAITPDFVIMVQHMPYGRPRDISVLLPPGIATSTIHVGDKLFVVGKFRNGVLYANDQQAWDPESDGDTDSTAGTSTTP
ncbi:MAG: hypothetical protein JWO50_59 [Candidatus Kaiserbacteria bacterium]|nr:hypothetical protein [Candidatus Kaiserbacteria bacterium]